MTKEKFNPGVHVISNERYHAAEGISRSGLWTFKQLPHKYWYEYLSGDYERPVDKEAFIIGELVHTLLLEPGLYPENFYAMPKVNRTTKAGKAAYEEAINEAGEKTLINSDQLELALAMVDSLKSNQVVRDVMKGDLKIEHSIFWEDQETGILCKARPDIWNSPLVGDLKTTKDASYRGFQSAAMANGYFLQAGMIYEACKAVGIPFEKFLFMCVEKVKPHPTGFYLLDDEALQFGIDLFHQLLRQYAECKYKDEWPDYGIKMMMIPRYATLELEHE